MRETFKNKYLFFILSLFLGFREIMTLAAAIITFGLAAVILIGKAQRDFLKLIYFFFRENKCKLLLNQTPKLIIFLQVDLFIL